MRRPRGRAACSGSDRRNARVRPPLADVGKSFPLIGAMLTITVASIARGGSMPTSEAFATVAMFQALMVGMMFLPVGLVLSFMITASFFRMESFVRRDERASVETSDANGAALSMRDVVVVRSSVANQPEASAKPKKKSNQVVPPKAGDEDSKEAEAPCGEDVAQRRRSSVRTGTFTLRVGSIDVPRGCVCALVGRVASGKTTLINTLLGDAAPQSADELCVGAVAALSLQTAFVLSGTIVENVVLGREFDEESFAFACSAADFCRQSGWRFCVPSAR